MTDCYVVRPNLGRPLILTPTQLESFRITVAGKSPAIDCPSLNERILPPEGDQVIRGLEGLQMELRTRQRSICLPLVLREWIMQPKLYLSMRPDIWKYNPQLRGMEIEGEPSPFVVPFPQTAMEHQHYAGFRWECKIKVEVDLPQDWQPEGNWPAMCSITLGDRTNRHAVYVTSRPPDPNDLRFIHLTDTHIAGRYDVIPQVIGQHLEPWQRKILQARYRNPNGNLRATIRYANEQAAEGKLDFVVLTGDIVDYYHDGYFRGDAYRYGYGRSAPTAPSPDTSNVRKFVDIFTGRDGLGESLNLPVFVVPGNHDYLCYEPLGALNIDPELEVPWWVSFLRLLRFVPILNLIVIFALPSELWHLPSDDRLNEEADKHPGLGLHKPEMLLFDLWKKGEEDRHSILLEAYKQDGLWASYPPEYEETQSLYGGLRYLRPKPVCFGQYLSEVSYDTDFAFSVGDHQFVCLNTGQDVDVPSVTDIILAKGQPHNLDTRGQCHFVQGCTHNRGLIPDHEVLLAEARLRAGSDGLILVFAHAPPFHHRHDPDPGPGMSEGGRYGRMDEWEDAPEELDLDYHIAEGLFPLIGQSRDGFDICFAGHTHGTVEYRVEISEDPREEERFGVTCWTGNYADSRVGPGDQARQWFEEHRPLFFTSGSLKRSHPQFRLVRLVDGCPRELDLHRHVPRLTPTTPAGPLARFLTSAVAHFVGVAGYRQSLKRAIDGPYLAELYDREASNDRAVVMWNLIDNFLKMGSYLRLVLRLGGYDPDGAGGYGICDEQDLTVHWWIPQWGFLTDNVLQRRNLELEEELSDEEERAEKYRRLSLIYDEIDLFLKRMSGWLSEDGTLRIPPWYSDRNNYEYHQPAWVCRLLRLLMVNIALWLNRFGLRPYGEGPAALDLEHHFNAIDPSSLSYLNLDCQKHILDLFEFAAQDDENPLCLWYAYESTYLAELGGYRVEERNKLDPASYLDWACSLPREAVAADILVKYQLQAERQFAHSGIEGLRRFYSTTSARLETWAATGASIDPDYYMEQCNDWDSQRMLDRLTQQVRGVAWKLTT